MLKHAAMPRAAELIQAYADALGLDEAHVALTARRLRENDLFIAETKSPRSWRLSPLDAASLLIALLSSPESLKAARHVMLAAEMELTSQRLEVARKLVAERSDMPRWLAQIVEEGEVSFLRAVELLIFNAMGDRNGFAQRFAHSSLEITPLSRRAHLYGNATSPLAGTAVPDVNLDFYASYTGPLAYGAWPDLEFSGRCSWKAIAAAAEVLTGIH